MMNTTRHFDSRTRSMGKGGVALISALAILVVIVALAAGGFVMTQLELGIARNDATSAQAYYVAQTGLQQYKTALYQNFRWLETQELDANPERTACFDRMGPGLDWDRSGSAENPWSSDRVVMPMEDVFDLDGDVIGAHQVTIFRDASNPKYYTIESRGRASGARATVRATVLLENSGVLSQAIFAGSGQANKFINGGVTIRGGVYVVGDDSDPDQTVFNTNGNFSLLNDYDLTSDIAYDPFESRVTSANLTADQLCASLRVEDGRVELGGSVKLGDPSNRLLGVHVGDNADDLIVTGDLEQCEDAKGICADIGPDTFDISDAGAPDFPTFDSPPSDTSECTLDTWRDCIHDEATTNGLAVTWNGSSLDVDHPDPGLVGTVVGQDVTPECRSALQTSSLVFDATDIDCTFKANGVTQGFSYDTSTSPATFTVHGSVNLRGVDVTFARDVEYIAETFATSGTGSDMNASFVVETFNGAGGDINLFGDFLTRTDASLGPPGYPEHVLGLIAEGSVFQDGDYVMAPIYAGDTYRIVKDKKLLGSVVTDYFCTTGAGGTTSNEKKKNSETSSDKCNAGQNSEIIYVNTGENTPGIMQDIQAAGIPVFKVLSYERR